MNQLADNKSEFEKLKKKGEFIVPEGYFEQLPFHVSERLSAQNSNSKLETPLWRKPAFAMASLVILIVAVLLFKPSTITDGTDFTEIDLFSELNRSEVIQYLSEAELDTYILTESIRDNTINNDIIFNDQDLSEEELFNSINWNDPSINI